MTNKNTAQSFKEAYELLKNHAETLRNQSEPNIDDLLQIVNESVAAYKVCKTRIDAVEKALTAAIDNAGIETQTAADNDDQAQQQDDLPF